uniref:(northern house mosquito) hypothetical protein n=1 Tax=Culex pipiens TaxID=7175 RepID=A0A8D8KF58_CULPI
MAPAQEAPDRAGPQARLEGLLGLSERYHLVVLPVRLAGGSLRRGRPEAPDHRGRRDHAADSGAPEAGLHLLSEHGVRGRVPVPGAVPGRAGELGQQYTQCLRGRVRQTSGQNGHAAPAAGGDLPAGEGDRVGSQAEAHGRSAAECGQRW